MDNNAFVELYGEHGLKSFIQWKGTYVCVDLICPKCEAQYHFDGEFLYSWLCTNCGQHYVMPCFVEPIPVSKDVAEDVGSVKEMRDEE